MLRNIFLLILICLVLFTRGLAASPDASDQDLILSGINFTHSAHLKEGVFTVNWAFNESWIIFKVKAKTKGWVGLGFNHAKGGMEGGDYFMGGIGERGSPYFWDYHLPKGYGDGKPVMDAINDWVWIDGSEVDGQTELTITRKLETCDKNDVPIGVSTLTLLWAFGNLDDSKLTSMDYHGENCGIAQYNLLDPPRPKVDTSTYKKWAVRVNNTMPAKDTTYHCTFHKSPRFLEKTHVIGFETYLPSPAALKHVHHFIVTRCVAYENETLGEAIDPWLASNPEGWDCEVDDEDFRALRKRCNSYNIYAWAKGGLPLYFPENMGYPVGEEEEHEYLMVELHYDNPSLESGVQFETGFDIFYTQNLREIDVAMTFVALDIRPTHFIPPRLEGFTLAGHCDSTCTKKLPEEGFYIFNGGLHAHTSGSKIKLRHFRKSAEGEEFTELPWILYDDFYDFDFQQSRDLAEPIKFLPGDQLTIECTYDTSKRENVTMFGLGTRNEMCIAYFWIYPKINGTQLGHCSSHPPLKIWEDFNLTIDSEYSFDPKITGPKTLASINMTYSEFLNTHVNWTESLVHELEDKMRFSRHQGICLEKPGEYSKTSVAYPKNFKEYQPETTICSAPSLPVPILSMIALYLISKLF